MQSTPQDWTYQTFAGMVSTPIHVGTVALSFDCMVSELSFPPGSAPSSPASLQAPVVHALAGC